MPTKIILAIISALSAIIVAWVTTKGTIKVSEPEIEEIKTRLNEISELSESELNKIKKKFEEISEIEKVANLPVGTVVSSLLTPTVYRKEFDDRSTFDPEKSEWVLADGEKDIILSTYGQLMNKRYTPDLRGMFIRGVNEGRSDGKQNPDEKKAGEWQQDSFEDHEHTMKGDYIQIPVPEKQGLTVLGSSGTWLKEKTSPPIDKGGDETRPNNVSVYFYIKIN